MSDADEQQINATLTDINRLLLNDGALIKFAPGSASTEPLEKALVKVLDVYFNPDKKKRDAARDSIDKAREAEKSQRRVAQEHAKELKKFLEKQKKEEDNKRVDSWGKLHNYLLDLSKSRKKSDKKLGQMYGQLTNIYRVSSQIVGFVKDIGEMFFNLAKDRTEFSTSLRESGVVLRDGFDASFHKLAVETGKTREQFADFLKKNSRFNV